MGETCSSPRNHARKKNFFQNQKKKEEEEKKGKYPPANYGKQATLHSDASCKHDSFMTADMKQSFASV